LPVQGVDRGEQVAAPGEVDGDEVHRLTTFLRAASRPAEQHVLGVGLGGQLGDGGVTQWFSRNRGAPSWPR
jgi:hypothetical protein